LKIIFLISVVFLFVLTPVYGESLSDVTGLVNRLDIQTGGHTFEVEVVSNFDVPEFEFDVEEKRLTLHITSGLQNNLGELQIPQSLLGGNFTFSLNDQQYFPKIKTNEKISFVTLNFTGTGNNKLDIFGTTYLSGLTETEQKESTILLEEIEEPEADYLWLIVLAGSLCVSGFIILKKRKTSLSR